MRKRLLILFLSAGLLPAIWAQTTIIDTDFSGSDSPSYSDANMIGQNGWTVSPNTGANAFNIIGVASNGWADTLSAIGNFDTNNGNYAYLNSIPVGNAVDTEWNGSMDFTVNVSTNAYGASDVFRVGTSSAIGVSTGLVGTAESDVYLRVNRASNGRIRIQAHDAADVGVDLLEIDNVAAGWDALNGDRTTDPLRVVWNVRKTRESGFYRITASLENLNPSNSFTTAASTVYIQKTIAYSATASSFVMGHALGAAYNKTSSSFDIADITIDKLSFVETTGVNPVLQNPVVTVSEGDSVVNLAWNNVFEADEYDVKRSVTGINGTYITQISGLTTNGWQDVGLINGNEYYYIVTAKGVDASDVNSDPVLGAPFVPVTGTFLDTSFQSSETPAYTDGNLVGQDRWKAIAATEPNAFNVDTNGNGFAESESNSNLVVAGVASQVFYNKPTSNEVGNAWSGTVNFSLIADAGVGLYKTNTYNETVGTNTVVMTNIQHVANLTGSEAFSFGLTSDPSTELQPKGDDDVLINVRYTGSGDVTFGLNQYNADANLMLTVPRTDLGWDPQWQDQPASNAPIFETDPISLDWSIRKATVTNTYNAEVIATIGGNSYTGLIAYTDASDTKNLPDDAYAAELVRFGMGQKVKSEDERIFVSVDAISVTHTNTSDIPIGIPGDVKGTLGNLAINLTWSAGGEQDSFNVYRSEVQGGPYSNIVVGVTDQAYTDSGLTDLRTYFYVVTADYGAIESDYSKELIKRALGITNPLSWGLSPNINTAGSDQQMTGWTTDASGTYQFVSGAGIDGSFISEADLTWYNTSAAPLLHGIVQQAADGGKEYYTIKNAASSDLLRIKADDGASNTPGSKMFWVEGASVDADNQVVSLEMSIAAWNNVRAIIRNGSTWYASEQIAPSSIPNIEAANWIEFTPATAADTGLVAATNTPVSGTTLALSQINAAGWMSSGDNHTAKNSDFWKLNVGTQPSSYDLWTDGHGIYNGNAAGSNDSDGDGLSNVWEWGFGGNPTDLSDVGITDRFEVLDGSNFVYIYPRLKDANARPNYSVLESADLVHGDFSDQQAGYTITAGGTWTNKPDFEAVTNEIPITDAVKFFKLRVE